MPSQRSGTNDSGSSKFEVDMFAAKWLTCTEVWAAVSFNRNVTGQRKTASPGIHSPDIVAPSGDAMRGNPSAICVNIPNASSRQAVRNSISFNSWIVMMASSGNHIRISLVTLAMA